MRLASSFNGRRIRASTFRSIGRVHKSLQRLARAHAQMLRCMSMLLAQSRHPDFRQECPFLGEQRTLQFQGGMSAVDQLRHTPSHFVAPHGTLAVR
jgi:hypothetical protein